MVAGLSYDDFYKFLVSLGILTVISSAILLDWLHPEITAPIRTDIFSAIILIVMFIVGMIFLGWGSWKWHNRQKLLDEREKADTTIMIKKKELMRILEEFKDIIIYSKKNLAPTRVGTPQTSRLPTNRIDFSSEDLNNLKKIENIRIEVERIEKIIRGVKDD